MSLAVIFGIIYILSHVEYIVDQLDWLLISLSVVCYPHFPPNGILFRLMRIWLKGVTSVVVIYVACYCTYF